MSKPYHRAWPANGRLRGPMLMAICVATLPLVAGCAGAGRIELTSLNLRAIDPPAPRTYAMRIDHCYWWQDDDGQVWVALERTGGGLFGRLSESSFQMSLVLEDLPAGEARNYLVSKRELRAVLRAGPVESRFVSSHGILALYREPGDRLRGSFRLYTQRETIRFLGGWTRPMTYLMNGEFIALHDEQRGRVIADATEPEGWERAPLADED
ncbi:MAG: hypothetical protein JXO22_10265 [Phycisphaerae bacterium]|nr:hypothetical protein [Phycisphaerae bacterium]